MSTYTNLATNIIKNVGGKENVKDLKHCVTRLRFTLIDESKANDEVLKNMDGVISVVKAMGQYMVVIGEHVGDVYDEVCKQLGFDVLTPVIEEKKGNLIDQALQMIMAGMGPTLNLLCACGVIKGLLVIVASLGLPTDSGTYMLLNAAGDCLFFSLPLILGFNVAKKCGIDPYFGLLLGSALCYPSIQGVDLDFFGYVVNATYSSSFLPVLFGMILAVPLYKFFDKHIHPLLKGFFTPLLTLLIAFPLTFIVIGPIANLVGLGINTIINSLFTFSPVVAGFILGGLWQILVMFGVHGIPTMFAFYDLLAGNPSLMLAIISPVCFGVAGVLLAMVIKTKNTDLKSVSISAMISAILGVTEPAMYGIIIPRKKMLAIVCTTGAISGAIVALLNLKLQVYAGMGIIGMLGLIDSANPNYFGIALVIFLPLIMGTVLGMLLYKDEDFMADHTTKPIKTSNETHVIAMPIDGIIQPLSSSSDGAFASEALGKGCVVIPENGKIYAPVSGVVRTLFPAKHAIGLVTNSGVEVLIHIGINTVNLNGEHFEALVQQGDEVMLNQPLVNFDKEAIEKAGYSSEVIVVVTNTKDFLDIVELDHNRHKHGADMLKIIC